MQGGFQRLAEQGIPFDDRTQPRASGIEDCQINRRSARRVCRSWRGQNERLRKPYLWIVRVIRREPNHHVAFSLGRVGDARRSVLAVAFSGGMEQRPSLKVRRTT